MKPYLVTALFIFTLSGFADDRSVEFDPNTDFAKYTTFHMREGRIAAKSPELNNSLVKDRIAAALRAQLSAKGLKEAERADLAVGFHFGSANKRQVESWPAGRWGWQTRHSVYRFTEGTLVVDLIDRTSKELVWRGIYRDDESNAKKIAGRIDEDVRKLFDKFPPKKK